MKKYPENLQPQMGIIGSLKEPVDLTRQKKQSLLASWKGMNLFRATYPKEKMFDKTDSCRFGFVLGLKTQVGL